MSIIGGKITVEFDRTKLNHSIKTLSSKRQTKTILIGLQINLVSVTYINVGKARNVKFLGVSVETSLGAGVMLATGTSTVWRIRWL